jgi:hypothetical protein
MLFMKDRSFSGKMEGSMNCTYRLAGLSLALVLFLPALAGAAQNVARQTLDRKLAEYRGATEGEVIEVTHPALARLFPRSSVFVLRFRMFPVARLPQPPLTANNIFIVSGQQTQLITDAAALQRFFTGELPRIESGAAAESAAQAWLRLVQELHQDGFFRFGEPTISGPVMTRDQPPSNIRITGTLPVTPNNGDMGQIATTLVFERGKLSSASDKVDLKQGIRPICQATKLLDPDPIVRGMAEQSILVMGRAARAYLDEQRALATPELQQAIDRIWNRIVAEGR